MDAERGAKKGAPCSSVSSAKLVPLLPQRRFRKLVSTLPLPDPLSPKQGEVRVIFPYALPTLKLKEDPDFEDGRGHRSGNVSSLLNPSIPSQQSARKWRPKPTTAWN